MLSARVSGSRKNMNTVDMATIPAINQSAADHEPQRSLIGLISNLGEGEQIKKAQKRLTPRRCPVTKEKRSRPIILVVGKEQATYRAESRATHSAQYIHCQRVG